MMISYKVKSSIQRLYSQNNSLPQSYHHETEYAYISKKDFDPFLEFQARKKKQQANIYQQMVSKAMVSRIHGFKSIKSQSEINLATKIPKQLKPYEIKPRIEQNLLLPQITSNISDKQNKIRKKRPIVPPRKKNQTISNMIGNNILY